MSDVEELLNDSIATEGYHIGPASKPEALINLSEIDFEALQAKFAKSHKRTEAEKLKRLIEGKLQRMVKANASRVELAEKFEKLIAEYNAGSQNIEVLFARLVKFARELNEEEKRGVAKGLSEEELALFDILTKPEPTLTKAEEAAVKKVCRELLLTLKREKLILDWREKQQARAAVMQTLKLEMRRLPAPFTKDIRGEKMARAYAHVYDHYFGAGQRAIRGRSGSPNFAPPVRAESPRHHDIMMPPMAYIMMPMVIIVGMPMIVIVRRHRSDSTRGKVALTLVKEHVIHAPVMHVHRRHTETGCRYERDEADVFTGLLRLRALRRHLTG